jgi:hypothetical protein
MGDSHHGTLDSHHSNNEFNQNIKSSHLNEGKNPSLKQSLQT